MMESLGMLVQPAIIKAIMDEADADQSGEIDFEEFFGAMKTQAEKKGGGAFAALVNRKNSEGPALKWRTDEMGTGVTIDEDQRVLRKAGVGWGTQTLDTFIKSTSSVAGTKSTNYDACSVLVEVVALSSKCYLGLVGHNFNGWRDDVEPTKNSHAIVVNTETGELVCKKTEAPLSKMCPIMPGDRFQTELDLKKSEARLTALKWDAAEEVWTTKSSVVIEIPSGMPAVTFAVGFGAVPDALPPCEIKLVGTSCEKLGSNEMDQNVTVSNEARAAQEDPTTAAAASVAG